MFARNCTKSFKVGQSSGEDDETAGRPISVSTSENIDAVYGQIVEMGSIICISETLRNLM